MRMNELLIRDIHLPPPIPPYEWAGWLTAVLLVVAATMLLLASLQLWSRYRRRERRRFDLIELDSLPFEDAAVFGTEFNSLLKRIGIRAYGRREVAGLEGRPWLSFLNGSCPEPVFTGRCARWLMDGDWHRLDSRVPVDASEQARQWILRRRESMTAAAAGKIPWRRRLLLLTGGA